MGSIFNMDGPLFRVISRFADLAIVNILWLVCSLPVFTIGASTTALYSVSMKMARDEEGKITKNFFDAFKSNFKQATIIWLIMLLIIIIIGADLYLCFAMPELLGSLSSYVKALATAGLILLFLAAEFIFPVLSRFENTTKNTVKNAILMEFGNLGYFLIITIINCIIPAIFLLYTEGFLKMLVLLLIFGMSIPAYINSNFFRKMLEKYEKE